MHTYLPIHPLYPPKMVIEARGHPEADHICKALILSSVGPRGVEMAALPAKVDGMIQPRGCGNILPNNDRSEMCFQRQRVRTWYIPPCPACCLLQMRQAATGSGDSMSAGTGGTRHSTNGAGGRGRPGAVVRIPIKCPGSLDTAKLRVGTRDLPPWAAGPSRFLLKRVAEC